MFDRSTRSTRPCANPTLPVPAACVNLTEALVTTSADPLTPPKKCRRKPPHLGWADIAVSCGAAGTHVRDAWALAHGDLIGLI